MGKAGGPVSAGGVGGSPGFGEVAVPGAGVPVRVGSAEVVVAWVVGWADVLVGPGPGEWAGSGRGHHTRAATTASATRATPTSNGRAGWWCTWTSPWIAPACTTGPWTRPPTSLSPTPGV